MKVVESDTLYKQINDKGLYEVLKEEYIFNKDFQLTEEEKQEIKCKIEKELIEEIGEIYTIGELWEDYHQFLEDMGVPESIIYYVDVFAMMKDEIMGGYLNYKNFSKGNREFLVFWRRI